MQPVTTNSLTQCHCVVLTARNTTALSPVCFKPNIVRVIKSRRMRWAGHVARMGEERGVYRVLVGKPEERDHWET